MQIVFLDDLPKWKIGTNRNRVNWKLAEGCIVNFIYNDITGSIEITGVDGKNLYIKYLDKPIFKITTDNLRRCKLGNMLKKYTGDFKYEIGQIIKNKKINATIIDRKKQRDKLGIERKYYKYKCNKCGFDSGKHYKNQEHREEYWMNEGGLLNGNGCACCCSPSKIVVEGINDIPTTASFIIKWFQGGYEEAKLYTKSSECLISPICSDCGRIKDKKIKICDIYKNHSIACICSDKVSYPNKLAYSLLNQINEVYKFDCLEREYSPNWIGSRSYDNYFVYNGKEYILEMDGGWHTKDNKMSGQTKEESKQIDDEKDRLANKNRIEVIRIDCCKSDLKFIKQNILTSRLNNLFNLSIIDWFKCEEIALSNLVKVACGHWNNGIKSTKDISKIMNMNRSTIIEYLKKGNNIWCSYNAKEEMRKNGARNGALSRKYIINKI